MALTFRRGLATWSWLNLLSEKALRLTGIWRSCFGASYFFICVGNTDDYLRNHGFLLTTAGWTLSPAYDVNPNPKGTGLKLNISAHDNSLDLDLAIEVAPLFRLTADRAAAIIQNTANAVSKWRQVAAKYKLSRGEQDRMSLAFRGAV
jgi:serine/threonine-protein kinase HipA